MLLIDFARLLTLFARRSLVLPAAIGLLLCGEAHAQEPVEAQRLAAEAHQAYASGRIEESIRLYREAYALDAHPVLQFNLARTLEAYGDLPAARDGYERVVASTDIDEIRSIATKRLDWVLTELRAAGFSAQTVSSEQFMTTRRISIRSAHEGVDVYLDGHYLGRTPLDEIPVRPGHHEFFFTADDLMPETRRVLVTDAGPDQLYINLEPRDVVGAYVTPPPGRLSVIGPVAGMSILIDGSSTGEITPVLDYVLPAGSYTVRLTHPLYHSSSQVVRIEPGERATVDFSERMVQYRDSLPLRPHQKAGNILMPVGAGILAAGVTSGALALRDSNRYNDNPSDPDRRRYYDRGQAEALAADVLIPLGAAALVTGVILRVVRGAPVEGTDARGYRQDLFQFSASPMRSGARVGFRASF